MKSLKYLFALLSIIGISLQSCDVVEGPFVVVQEVCDPCEVSIFPAPETQVKKILLEDYTGHKCGNCPRAAEKADELKEIYGDQLVVLAVHAGFFATPFEGDFETDYRTETGTEWDGHFGNSNAGNPNGMVNRKGYPEGAHILQHSQWAQKIEEQINGTKCAGIQIMAYYNEAANLICVDTQTEILCPLDGDLQMNIVLTESGVIDYQTDYDADPQVIEDYEHNHVMRKSLTGFWGQSLGQEAYITGDLVLNRTCTQVDPEWDLSNMSVIAFVSNSDTYEVLQAEEISLLD